MAWRVVLVCLFCLCLLSVSGSVLADGIRADETFTLAGTVYLEGQSDLSGTTVSLESTVVPSLGFWGLMIVLALVTLVLIGRKQVKPAMVVLFIGVGVFSLGGLVSGALVVVTGADGTYALTNPGGEFFVPRTYAVNFEHTGFDSQRVQFTLPANAGQTYSLPDVTLMSAETPTPTPAAFFSEDFDSYAAGSTIRGQGGWELWGESTDAQYDGTVTDSMSASSPNSLALGLDSDIVHRFSGANSGMWYVKIKAYVPSSQTGDLLFILLNQYDPGTNAYNWSLQVKMSAGTGTVYSLGGTDFSSTAQLPLVTDQWVELRAEIDLDANQCTIFYNETQLDQTSWQASGSNDIAAVDLFSDKSSDVWYDDFSVDTNP